MPILAIVFIVEARHDT